MPPEIASPETTGRWELALHEITDGKQDPNRFMDGIRKMSAFLVEYARDKARPLNFPEDPRKKKYASRGGKGGGGSGEGEEVSFLKSLLLQFINVKMILAVLTCYTAFILPATDSLPELLAHGAVGALCGTFGFLMWGAAGGLLRRWISRHPKAFRLTMAAVLVLCGVRLFL